VSEPIPLSATLCIQLIDVVIYIIFRQYFDLMVKRFPVERRLTGHIERKTATNQDRTHPTHTESKAYFKGTISPVWISFAAAATRLGVRRLRRPICQHLAYSLSGRSSLTNVVVGTPNPRSLCRRTRYLRQLLSRREYGRLWIPRDCRRSLVSRDEVFDLRQALACHTLRFCHRVVLRRESSYVDIEQWN
jgi:hypothetical protein